MKAFLTVALFVIAGAIGDEEQLKSDLELTKEVKNAKSRFENDFLLGIWYRSNEAIVESRERLLRLYTHYTVQQAEQVVQHVNKYRNLSLAEASEKREKLLAGNSIGRVLKLTECIFKCEDGTVQAYKMTGYNLHNCIRLAQIETETRYLETLREFDRIKRESLEMHDYYSQKVDNCLDKICVVDFLVQSVEHYEKLLGDIAKGVTELNGINTRYLLQQIALNCVSNSMVQIEENYKIGKRLVEDCFKNETVIDPPKENGGGIDQTNNE